MDGLDDGAFMNVTMDCGEIVLPVGSGPMAEAGFDNSPRESAGDRLFC